ncbi:MAG: ATP phosphoribosyltransferase regulatory subunit [Kofleriaceae bacterium]|nr:ATP phosphoribosyltransferase regulatory subunit [Kofleriaceae bacterium]
MAAPTPAAIRLPAGVRDYLPRAAGVRRAVTERVMATFESWGYRRIITPLLECADVLARGLGQSTGTSAIHFVEPTGGEVVALRPDITPQVARLAATRLAAEARPLRLCYEGAVTRISSRPGPAELAQAGVELIGATGPGADGEVIALAAATLAAWPAADVRLELGHVGPVGHLLATAPSPAARDLLLRALRDRDRAALARAAAPWPAATRRLAEVVLTLTGPADEVLAEARRLAWPVAVKRALAELAAAMAVADELGADGPGRAAAAPRLLDLGEVRGMGYYTGLRIAGYVAGAADAVLRGGRYDELLARYDAPAPAIGLAVDLEALAEAVGADARGPACVVVVAADRRRAARVAAGLRAAGHHVVVGLGAARAGARSFGVDVVVDLTAGVVVGPASQVRIGAGLEPVALARAVAAACVAPPPPPPPPRGRRAASNTVVSSRSRARS